MLFSLYLMMPLVLSTVRHKIPVKSRTVTNVAQCNGWYINRDEQIGLLSYDLKSSQDDMYCYFGWRESTIETDFYIYRDAYSFHYNSKFKGRGQISSTLAKIFTLWLHLKAQIYIAQSTTGMWPHYIILIIKKEKKFMEWCLSSLTMSSIPCTNV